MNSRNMVLMVSVMFLFGCATAKWVEKTYEPSKKGVVKYINEGFDSMKEKQRAGAIQKIEDFCGSVGYTLMKETSESEKIGSTVRGKVDRNRVSIKSYETKDEFVLLHFRCGK